MEKNNGRKWTIAAFSFVCVALAGLTIAFASLSEELKINPSLEVKSGTWKVEFEDAQLVSSSAEATASAPTTLATTISGIEVSLKNPGDTVVYTFDVVNKGDIDAKIGDISIPTIKSSDCTGEPTEDGINDAALVCANIEYELTYTDGGAIPMMNDTLPRLSSGNNVRNMTLTITYGTGGTDVPKGDVTIGNLEIIIIYVQD